MAVIVAEYKQPVTGPNGVACKAKACALATPKGAWHGWIEFNPLDGAPTFRSPRETEQPSRQAIILWADALTVPRLEASLDRALERLGVTPVIPRA